MSTEEQETRASGSVPHTYGNALAWKWTREMPASLKGGFLTMLYALRAMANANGELRFHGDHKAIRIQDIAKAAGAREKDARRYLDAAVIAGVAGVKGERRRGKPTLYTLIMTPWPNWSAAADHLKATSRGSGKSSPVWPETAESSGHGGPNKIGPRGPELTGGTQDEVRATGARWSSGHGGPNGSGPRGPNNPGGFQESSHDAAEVAFQPQVVGPTDDEIDHQEDHPEWTRCTGCGRPIAPDPQRPGRTIHAACQRRAERNSA